MLQLGLTPPVLAQVNAFLNWSQFLGVGLAGSGIALYALRSMRPKLARDHDIFFAAVALLCGGIMFFQGWRQDPILQFGQFLLTGCAIFFAVESIRLRGVATEQAKRNTPIVDDERPVSRVYRAELDEITPFQDKSTSRRIRGSRDARSGREEYEGEARPRKGARPADDRAGDRRRRPRGDDGSGYASLNEAEDIGDRPSRRGASPSRSGNQPPSEGGLRGESRPRRSRPAVDDEPPVSRRNRPSRSAESPASEYVDYRPIEDDEDW